MSGRTQIKLCPLYKIKQRNINEKDYLNILNNQQVIDQMTRILKKDKIPYSIILNNTNKNDLIKIVDNKINKIN